MVGVSSCGSVPASPEPTPQPTLQPPHFRVVSYNVLVAYGNYAIGDPYHPGAQRKANILCFLADEKPDVVAFQELNGYTEEKLLEDAKAWGHTHAVMLKPGGYPTALTSTRPIEVIERKLDGMHHGLMRLRTHGIDFVVVHLWPFKDAARMREVEPALAMSQRARAEGRPTVMLGDFNAVATSDVPLFDDVARERFAKWKWETDADGRPRTDVLDACLATGLVDVWGKHRGTVPSMQVPRIDFVLASPDLATTSTGARWLADPELLKNSDHPAVVADFAWAAPAPR